MNATPDDATDPLPVRLGSRTVRLARADIGWWRLDETTSVRRSTALEVAAAMTAARASGGDPKRLIAVLRAAAVDGPASPLADAVVLALAVGDDVAMPATAPAAAPSSDGWTRIRFDSGASTGEDAADQARRDEEAVGADLDLAAVARDLVQRLLRSASAWGGASNAVPDPGAPYLLAFADTAPGQSPAGTGIRSQGATETPGDKPAEHARLVPGIDQQRPAGSGDSGEPAPALAERGGRSDSSLDWPAAAMGPVTGRPGGAAAAAPRRFRRLAANPLDRATPTGPVLSGSKHEGAAKPFYGTAMSSWRETDAHGHPASRDSLARSQPGSREPGALAAVQTGIERPARTWTHDERTGTGSLAPWAGPAIRDRRELPQAELAAFPAGISAPQPAAPLAFQVISRAVDRAPLSGHISAGPASARLPASSAAMPTADDESDDPLASIARALADECDLRGID